MKTILFTTLIATAATLAAAKGAKQPEWNHANDSGPIAGLQQVEQPQGQRFKKKDRIEYTAPSTGTYQDNSYRSLAREGSR
ncbi:hypothetical protein [Neisseria yangbaofengii]|uniref:hypothetical protein n=1 Tax=Neisseria yangbaofengii TaxID=2709396 RepID=UPI0013E9E819|nr:hypothetical protein [Neisseria yangbaofengii]